MVAAVLAAQTPTRATALYGDIDTKYIAPTGEFASIPWGRVGFRTYGTSTPPAWPISPNWALRAHHAAGGVTGYDIEQNGVFYNVVQSVRVANSDLELVRVSQPFSSFFNMYRGQDEIGKELVLFGSNRQSKSVEVRSEGTNRFNGWYITGQPLPPNPGEDARLNWGRNRVHDYVNVFGTETLYATFDAPSTPGSMGDDEGIAYNGDSSGAFFIQQAGEWRLAGIIYAVDAAYFREKDTQINLGAIFDARDLWEDVPVDPAFPNGPKRRVRITGDGPVPFGSYASRISTYRGSIDTITQETADLGLVVVPEPGAGLLMLLGTGGGLVVAGIVRRRRGA